jgi:hypothetical protein
MYRFDRREVVASTARIECAAVLGEQRPVGVHAGSVLTLDGLGMNVA